MVASTCHHRAGGAEVREVAVERKTGGPQDGSCSSAQKARSAGIVGHEYARAAAEATLPAEYCGCPALGNCASPRAVPEEVTTCTKQRIATHSRSLKLLFGVAAVALFASGMVGAKAANRSPPAAGGVAAGAGRGRKLSLPFRSAPTMCAKCRTSSSPSGFNPVRPMGRSGRQLHRPRSNTI